jgi:hypothetical protein
MGSREWNPGWSVSSLEFQNELEQQKQPSGEMSYTMASDQQSSNLPWLRLAFSYQAYLYPDEFV